MNKLKEHIYWPKDPGYSIPFYLGPVLYLLVSAFNIFGSWNVFSSMPMTLAACLAMLPILLFFNGLLLWTHMRPQFLTWGTARDQFQGTYLLLTLICLLLSSIILLVRGRAQIVLRHPELIDWIFTVKCIDFGLLGLTIALSVSAIWKSHEPGISNLRQERDTALELAHQLSLGKIDKTGYQNLNRALNQTSSSSELLAARLDGKNLHVLLAWKEGAQILGESIYGIPYEEIKNIRPDLDRPLRKALALLQMPT